MPRRPNAGGVYEMGSSVAVTLPAVQASERRDQGSAEAACYSPAHGMQLEHPDTPSRCHCHLDPGRRDADRAEPGAGRGVAGLSRRQPQPALLAARPNLARERRAPAGGVGTGSRADRPEARVQERGGAALRRRHAVHDRGHQPRRRRARSGHRGRALALDARRRRTHGQVAAPQLRAGRRLLDRRPRRAAARRHAGLPTRLARREDRPADPDLRRRTASSSSSDLDRGGFESRRRSAPARRS